MKQLEETFNKIEKKTEVFIKIPQILNYTYYCWHEQTVKIKLHLTIAKKQQGWKLPQQIHFYIKYM